MKDNIKNILETLMHFAFLLGFCILVILVSLGVKGDFSKVSTFAFWIEVTFQLIATLVIFNIVYKMDFKNRTHKKESRFFIAYATNRLRIIEIEKRKMYPELDEAIRNKNHEMIVEKSNALLHKYCTRINYEDVVGDEDIPELLDRFRVFEKSRENVTELILKIRQGRIKIHELDANIFLRDKELSQERPDVYDFNVTADSVKRNATKAISFLAYSVVFAIFSFSFVNPNFWQTLITNITLFLSSASAAFFNSARDVNKRTSLYEKRNSFLHRYLNLTVEYKAENTIK